MKTILTSFMKRYCSIIFIIIIIPFIYLCTKSYVPLHIDGEGSAVILPQEDLIVENKGDRTIEFTVGKHGIAVGGGITAHFYGKVRRHKVGFTHRTAWWTPPQTDNPEGPGYIYGEVKTDSRASFEIATERISPTKDNPLFYIRAKVLDAPLKEGDKIRIFYNNATAPKVARKHKVYIMSDGDGDGGYLNDGGFYDISESPFINVVGRDAVSFNVVIPAITQINESFSVKVVARDRYFNLDPNYKGTVSFNAPEYMTGLPEDYTFTNADRGRHVFENASVTQPGILRITVSDGSISSRSNPAKVYADSPSTGLYFGMIHGHSELSDGAGTIDEEYLYARDIACLDFGNTSEHAYELRSTDIALIQERAVFYNDPPRYSTFFGWEWTPWDWLGSYGHKNAYFVKDYQPVYHYFYKSRNAQRSDTPDEFWALLEKNGEEVITIPHHTGGHMSTDWSYRNDKMQRLVEIYSMHGSSEYYGCPKQLQNPRPGHFVQDALKMGHILGFTGDADCHDLLLGNTLNTEELRPLSFYCGAGLTAVYAPENNRRALYDGLYNRYCYATSGERIYLNFAMDGHNMGSTYRTTTYPKMEMEAAGTTPITKVELFKYDGKQSENFQVVWTRRPGTWDCTYTFTDEKFENDSIYYLRVTQEDEEMAWASPIWIKKI